MPHKILTYEKILRAVKQPKEISARTRRAREAKQRGHAARWRRKRKRIDRYLGTVAKGRSDLSARMRDMVYRNLAGSSQGIVPRWLAAIRLMQPGVYYTAGEIFGLIGITKPAARGAMLERDLLRKFGYVSRIVDKQRYDREVKGSKRGYWWLYVLTAEGAKRASEGG